MNSVLVTGSNGGIGTAICQLLKNRDYRVIGVDRTADRNGLDAYIKFDVRDIVTDVTCRAEFSTALNGAVNSTALKALINNAAIQILGGLEQLEIEDFRKSMDINLVAPLVLSKLTYEHLKAATGSIVNVGSIHARLTKPGFVSYATSKSALMGLTHALAVDVGSNVRVNAVQPAATATEMLVDGFKENPEAFGELKAFHPTNSIAAPGEIAEVVCFLISGQCQFLNGSIIDINGGIGARLHDPV